MYALIGLFLLVSPVQVAASQRQDAACEAHHRAQAPVPHRAAKKHQERAGMCD